MLNLKNKINREKTDSYIQRTNRWLSQVGRVGNWAKKVKKINRYKLSVKSQGYNIPHKEYGQ